MRPTLDIEQKRSTVNAMMLLVVLSSFLILLAAMAGYGYVS